MNFDLAGIDSFQVALGEDHYGIDTSTTCLHDGGPHRWLCPSPIGKSPYDDNALINKFQQVLGFLVCESSRFIVRLEAKVHNVQLIKVAWVKHASFT